MRFEVEKSLNGDYYIIWDNKLHQNYKTNGILMRGSKQEMEKAAADLNRLQMTQQKLRRGAEHDR